MPASAATTSTGNRKTGNARSKRTSSGGIGKTGTAARKSDALSSGPSADDARSPRANGSHRAKQEPESATVQAPAERPSIPGKGDHQALAPARSIWRGTISFGMVSIPVKLFPATASKKTFNYVANALFRCLWRWAKRRHPRKSRFWIKDRYFGYRNGNHWRFFGETRDESGRLLRNWLYHAATTPIRRHVKIRGDANPYDPEWEVYLEKRLGVKMAGSLLGRRGLSRLWREQKGRCPVCGQLITHETGWHNHHIVWRVRGGSDGIENRVLLHPNCHNQVHTKDLSVSKPRP